MTKMAKRGMCTSRGKKDESREHAKQVQEVVSLRPLASHKSDKSHTLKSETDEREGDK